MASEQSTKELIELAQSTIIDPIDKLVKNANWGSINFESSRSVLETGVFSLCKELQLLPLDMLPDSVVRQFIDALKPVSETIAAIRKFSVETGEPKNQRNQLTQQLNGQHEQLLRVTHSWLPYLAHKRGDLEEKLGKIESITSKAKASLDEIEVFSNEKKMRSKKY